MANDEHHKARDFNLEKVIDWKEIVDIYYQVSINLFKLFIKINTDVRKTKSR
jgi:hypothetical protein